MNILEAKSVLNDCTRGELRDHAFGDVEVFWTKEGKEIAGGYFGGGKADIWFNSEEDGHSIASFADGEARELRSCGFTGRIDRNDETGPTQFVEGYTMPGLTLAGVLEEITTSPEQIMYNRLSEGNENA